MIEFAREMLESWGEWQRKLCGVDLSLPHATTEQRSIHGRRGYSPDNPEAEALDKILARLLQREPELAQPLKYKFIWQYSSVIAASELRISRSEYNNRVEQICNYVAGAVDQIVVDSEKKP